MRVKEWCDENNRCGVEITAVTNKGRKDVVAGETRKRRRKRKEKRKRTRTGTGTITRRTVKDTKGKGIKIKATEF